MAKKTAHLDSLGPYDNWRAPWETEGGDDAEIDKPKLKRLIFNLKQDYAKSRDSHDETKEALAETEAALETAKEQAADANGAEAQKTIDKLQKKVDDLTKERDDLVSAKEQADLRAEVLGDLDPKYAKYVQGTTKEELEKSLEAVKEDFGLAEDSGNDDGDEDEDQPTGRTSPRSRVTLRNPGDKGGKGGDEEYDFDKIADSILVGGAFG